MKTKVEIMFDHFKEEISNGLAEKILDAMEEYGIQEYKHGVMDYIDTSIQCATNTEKVS